MPNKIDYDRGAMFMIHQTTGMNIYMYMDDPGKYVNAFGNPVPERLAQEAGFDIEKYGNARVKKERKAQFDNLLEKELEGPQDEKVEPILERGGFKVYDKGLGRFNVVDPEGNQLNTTPLSKEVAELLVDQLAPKLDAKKGK